MEVTVNHATFMSKASGKQARTPNFARRNIFVAALGTLFFVVAVSLASCGNQTVSKQHVTILMHDG